MFGKTDSIQRRPTPSYLLDTFLVKILNLPKKSCYRREITRILATGYWLLATGYWLLATGYWLLASRLLPRLPDHLEFYASDPGFNHVDLAGGG